MHSKLLRPCFEKGRGVHLQRGSGLPYQPFTGASEIFNSLRLRNTQKLAPGISILRRNKTKQPRKTEAGGSVLVRLEIWKSGKLNAKCTFPALTEGLDLSLTILPGCSAARRAPNRRFLSSGGQCGYSFTLTNTLKSHVIFPLSVKKGGHKHCSTIIFKGTFLPTLYISCY